VLVRQSDALLSVTRFGSLSNFVWSKTYALSSVFCWGGREAVVHSLPGNSTSSVIYVQLYTQFDVCVRSDIGCILNEISIDLDLSDEIDPVR